MTAYVYILASQRNGTLYIGVTTDLAKRMTDHKNGVGSKFTAKYNMSMLVHLESYENLKDARSREHTLKRWRRVWKLELIEKDNPQWHDLSNDLL